MIFDRTVEVRFEGGERFGRQRLAKALLEVSVGIAIELGVKFKPARIVRNQKSNLSSSNFISSSNMA